MIRRFAPCALLMTTWVGCAVTPLQSGRQAYWRGEYARADADLAENLAIALAEPQTPALAEAYEELAAVKRRRALFGDAEALYEKALKIREAGAADPYETAMRLSQLQTQLEATFSITARMNELTLTKFL